MYFYYNKGKMLVLVGQGVYCNAHRSRDGCWVDASEVERTPEGRLKLYVARHGHGTYPKVPQPRMPHC